MHATWASFPLTDRSEAPSPAVLWGLEEEEDGQSHETRDSRALLRGYGTPQLASALNALSTRTARRL